MRPSRFDGFNDVDIKSVADLGKSHAFKVLKRYVDKHLRDRELGLLENQFVLGDPNMKTVVSHLIRIQATRTTYEQLFLLATMFEKELKRRDKLTGTKNE